MTARRIADYVIGNGIADDTSNLRAALSAAAGGRLVGDKSIACKITGPLTVPTGTDIDGRGMTVTNTASSSVFVLSNVADVAISGFVLVSGGGNAVAVVGNSNSVKVSDVKASGFERAFYVDGIAASLSDVRFDRCSSGGASLYGFEFRDCADVTASGCVAESAGFDGFKLSQKTVRVVVAGCTSRGNNEDGIDCYAGGDELTISDFRAYDNGGNGIYLKQDTLTRDSPSIVGYVGRATVSGAQCHGNGSAGVAVWATNFAGDPTVPIPRFVAIQGGVYSGNQYGVVVNGRGVSLSSPVAVGNAKHGVFFQSRALDCDMVGAVVAGNGVSAPGSFEGVRVEGSRVTLVGGHSVGVDDPSALTDAALAAGTPSQRYGLYVNGVSAADNKVIGFTSKFNVSNFVDTGTGTVWIGCGPSAKKFVVSGDSASHTLNVSTVTLTQLANVVASLIRDVGAV